MLLFIESDYVTYKYSIMQEANVVIILFLGSAIIRLFYLIYGILYKIKQSSVQKQNYFRWLIILFFFLLTFVYKIHKK
jgi:hypothetical protein